MASLITYREIGWRLSDLANQRGDLHRRKRGKQHGCRPSRRHPTRCRRNVAPRVFQVSPGRSILTRFLPPSRPYDLGQYCIRPASVCFISIHLHIPESSHTVRDIESPTFRARKIVISAGGQTRQRQIGLILFQALIVVRNDILALTF
jgi:hypothetical protein